MGLKGAVHPEIKTVILMSFLTLEHHMPSEDLEYNAHSYGLLWSLYTSDTRGIRFPAEFSSNPNQTHMSRLINVFRIIRKSQVDEFDQG